MHIFGSTTWREVWKEMNTELLQDSQLPEFGFTSLCQQPRVKNLLLSFPSSKAESLLPCADEGRRDSEMQTSFKITPREGQTLTNPIARGLPMLRCFRSPHQLTQTEVYQQQKQPTISNASILIKWKVLLNYLIKKK